MVDIRSAPGSAWRPWVAVVLVMWCGTALGNAGFGARVDHPLAFSPAGVTVVSGSPGSRSEIVVLAKDRPLLAGHILTDEGIIVETRTFRAPDLCAAIATGDFNGDGKREFALLSSGGTRVHATLRRPAGWITGRLGTGLRATKLLSADLNADGFGDVMCYGKSMAGGVVFFGSRTGLVDSAVTILPDVSVADAVSSDVNGDRVPDLLIADWLGNSITLFTGLDGVAFTEAVKVDVADEPMEVDLSESAPGAPPVIAVLMGGGSAVRVYSVRRAGEVILDEELRLEGRAGDVRLVDVDGNRSPELVVTTTSGILLSEVTHGRGIGPWRTYGLFSEPGGISVRDVDGDQKRDLVAVERSQRRLVVCANGTGGGASWKDAFVTPGDPVAAVLSDVNLDGKTDIVVACRRPPMLAVLKRDNRGLYSLEHTVGIPDKPVSVIAVPEGRDRERVVLTTHSPVNSLGVISFDERGAPAGVRTIETGDHPRVLTAARDSGGALRVLVMTGSSSGRGMSLSWFDELPGGRFIERQPGLPATMRVIHAVADSRDDGDLSAVAVLARDRTDEGLYAWTGRAFPPTLRRLGGLPAGSTRLLAGNLSADGEFTVFFVSDPPGREIGRTTYAGSSGQWSKPEVASAPAPDPDGYSMASDFTGDGRTDLLYADGKRRRAVLLPASVKEGLGEAVEVPSGKGTRIVAVSEPHAEGRRDLVVIREGANAVGIIRWEPVP